ncbi:hypothetical protein Pmar_PMAR023540 [Perkinsus marinus ATCC 50983]|uniref:Uncharacterized protein n=1 Tax=Perkinsus marinus (strain ATCC 50983 / TXsc) TaxID=423536 RepID=C5KCM4_PERM5|nr:hypothetical protein Pmar_PMAR023540 [Perkinsus marinus ATCC 50983]EER17623.1 hypothetical protein Pmar_PMAR023540 [Perkinsus marinus ATCC 50983]|eukprot:XP_002785827.1 hypothetical protein Pmar_PMAR023540 [Perkinsus marinus ATCC 50983]
MSVVARIDRSWQQRSRGRFRNILDLLSRKADISALDLLQMSQRQIESQLSQIDQGQVTV